MKNIVNKLNLFFMTSLYDRENTGVISKILNLKNKLHLNLSFLFFTN